MGLPLKSSHAQKVPHFRNPRDLRILMVLSLKNFPIKKYRGEGFLAKNAVFCNFPLPPRKKISNGCQSDNFDARRSAHGSSESKWPKFSETHAEKVSIFKIVGASPLQSQVIQKSCRQNR